MISPGFSQRVGTVVALKLDGFTPGFDHVVDAGNLQRLPALVALKQVFPRVIGFCFKQVPDGLNTSPVQGEPPGFAGFLFVDFYRLAGVDILNLVDPQLQKITGPEIRIDPNFYNIVGIKRRQIMATNKA